MQDFCERMKIDEAIRLPLEGSIDLTYRCNNRCRHCWVSIPAESPEASDELTLDQVTDIVDQARKMGCRSWAVSGGEPMVRQDFSEIFDYLTSKCLSYSLNTNGTLISPSIARLMRRKGSKMVALYGATEAVHDRVTRNPGSFEAVMRGIAYLKEAGAGFTVQLIPMKENYAQFNDMMRLAESLSPLYRIGASWFYLSARGDRARNREIERQRLEPRDVVQLDKPDSSPENSLETKEGAGCQNRSEKDLLFASCIAGTRRFHVDPYGGMSFCAFVQDRGLRYDLKKGRFEQGWEEFIPSIAETIVGGKEYQESCGSCDLRADCSWCPVYGYLEHGRHSAKVEYLCSVANESREYKKKWEREHRRHYRIGGLTVHVESDLPITESTFGPRFRRFETQTPGEEVVTIRHVFSLPDMNGRDRGVEVYRKPPWAIHRRGNAWIYVGISPEPADEAVDMVAVFSQDHARATIYHGERGRERFEEGNLQSLTLFPTDQILLARVLAEREGCCFHGAGAIMEKKGFLFLGHSGAGKSTMAAMLRGKGEILCDDRIIVRQGPEGIWIYGTWSHGDVPDVSPAGAPLAAAFFLEQAAKNALIPVEGPWERMKRLPAYLVKPLETREWWEKTLSVLEKVAAQVPCYRLQFDKNGGALDLLRKL